MPKPNWFQRVIAWFLLPEEMYKEYKDLDLEKKEDSK